MEENKSLDDIKKLEIITIAKLESLKKIMLGSIESRILNL